ncbi:hypothetical protein RGM3321_24190 [Pseudomonas sp. RGM3321]|nr:hypothetical protein [Pseudomonas sp. RGM 3321]MCJ2374399.1 hypothetical protein [Pseudomonas sp. RGM 3321]
MNLINRTSFAKKLMAAFIVCAMITLAVGGLGMLGINRLSDALELTFWNNLVSVANTNETMTALTTHNRGQTGRRAQSPQRAGRRRVQQGSRLPADHDRLQQAPDQKRIVAQLKL